MTNAHLPESEESPAISGASTCTVPSSGSPTSYDVDDSRQAVDTVDRNLIREVDLPWSLQYMGSEEVERKQNITAINRLIQMYDHAFLHNEVERVTARDLADDKAKQEQWFSTHNNDFKRITGDTVEHIFAALLQDAAQDNTVEGTPVWARIGGTERYSINLTMRQDWKVIDRVWTADPETDNKDIGRRYTYGPRNSDLSCAFDCALWVAIQLDVWRRRVDDFDSRTYSRQASENEFCSALKTITRTLWSRSTTPINYMRDAFRKSYSRVNGKRMADVTDVLDALLHDVPQLRWIRLYGARSTAEKRVHSAMKVKKQWKVTVTLGDKKPEPTWEKLVSDTMAADLETQGVADPVLVAGGTPYVLYVMPLARPEMRWCDFVHKYTEAGFTKITISPPTASGDTITYPTRVYELVGIVFIERRESGIHHYTVTWARAETGRKLHYDGSRPDTGTLRSKKWCREPELIPVSLFYEVVLDGSKET